MNGFLEFLLWALIIIASIPVVLIALGFVIFFSVKVLFVIGGLVGTLIAFAIGVCLFLLLGELFGFFPPGTFHAFWDQSMIQLGLLVDYINELRIWK
jgi:hypothetical protein